MKPQELNHYLIGYFEADEFWTVDETAIYKEAEKILSKQKQIFPKKEFHIMKKVTSYKIVENNSP
jgi:hypothetical protein